MSALPRPPRHSRSRFKRWMQPVVSPAVFDFWASRFNRTWSWERPLARVVAREQASRDAVTLVLAPNRHCGGFRPGQHINVSAEVHGARITRSYSLTDLPRADGRMAHRAGESKFQPQHHESRVGQLPRLRPRHRRR